jgi:hypothetical protein
LHNIAWGVDPRFQHPRNQPQKLGVRDPLSQDSQDLLMRHRVEKLGQIQIYDPVDGLPHDLVVEPAQGIMTAPSRSKAIRRLHEHGLVDRFQEAASQVLDDLIFRAANSQRPRGAVLLGNLDPSVPGGADTTSDAVSCAACGDASPGATHTSLW